MSGFCLKSKQSVYYLNNNQLLGPQSMQTLIWLTISSNINNSIPN